VTVRPIVQRFFMLPPADLVLTEERRLGAGSFMDDRGEPAERFPDFGESGYYNLFVNGVLQEGALYRVSPEALTIVPTGQTIGAGTPIVLESVGFAASVR